MPEVLSLGKDINSNVTYEIPFVTDNYVVSLTPNTEETLTVPSLADVAVIMVSAGDTILVSESSTTITVPTTSFTKVDASIINIGGIRKVTSGSTLRFISRTAPDVSVTFFQSK